ncbi:hypothetical protein HDA33_001731 [Micrococcus endophyticus]|uniref:Uncharacterized protein n=2 Tax=Micrococcus endophyticus TaxID=455343 RepID=A0A7W9N1K3_9MICC|nr:hypothetical protein [Micrococcus endophyticus]
MMEMSSRGEKESERIKASHRQEIHRREGIMNIEQMDQIEVVEVAGDETVASFRSDHC